MPSSSTRSFYKDLPPVPAGEGMCDISAHRDVPGDWCVVVVDIKGSTAAIEAGKYKDVNMISASAITAVLNAAGRGDIAYIFGGDGATLLVPAELSFEVAAALYGTRALARDSFALDMRAGILWVGDLVKMGAPVRVAKTQTGPGVLQTAMSGEGITRAEQLVKDPASAATYDIESLFAPQALAAKPPSFEGLSCRWQPLHSRNGADISLIILARQGDDAEKGALYGRLLEQIAVLCGKPEDWRPVSEGQLHLSSNPARLDGEARVQSFKKGRGARAKYLAGIFVQSFIGRGLFALGLKAGRLDGASYRKSLSHNTDYIKFDNVLRLVMDVSAAQQAALAAYLDLQVAQGLIFYGLHTAPAALMTCLVFDYGSDHFHFVDGADGGYALAAKALKLQIRQAAQEKAA